MNNIYALEKDKCTGCSACQQSCPKGCIKMKSGKNGFLYPSVDKDVCIECGKCLRVCPAYNILPSREPVACYAAFNKNDELRGKSSSGGIFIELAKYVLAQSGVVFGAVFDESWNVHHVAAQTLESVYAMMGSKYVQSRVEDTYKEAKVYLNEGRTVLFSGTPCQIAGLNRYLSKSYSNLITVDLVCHGVPGVKQWNEYLNEVRKKICQKQSEQFKINNVLFRDKRISWEHYSLTISISCNNQIMDFSHDNSTDIYIKGFLQNLYLRDSCFTCPSKKLSSGSDFTIGDLWGHKTIIANKINTNKGISLIVVNTKNGYNLLQLLKGVNIIPIDYNQAKYSNPNIINPTVKNEYMVSRFAQKEKEYSFCVAVNKTLKLPLYFRIVNKIKRICKS